MVRDQKRPRGTAFPPAGGGGGRNPAARVFGSKVRYEGNGGRGGETERRVSTAVCGAWRAPCPTCAKQGEGGGEAAARAGDTRSEGAPPPQTADRRTPPPLTNEPPPPTACKGGAGGGAPRGARGTGAAKRGY